MVIIERDVVTETPAAPPVPLAPTSFATESSKASPSRPNANLDRLVERHLLRRIIIGIAILVPIAAAAYAALVALALRHSGIPAGAPIAIGAGVGVLAAFFWGMWIGIVASVNELEDLERSTQHTKRRS